MLVPTRRLRPWPIVGQQVWSISGSAQTRPFALDLEDAADGRLKASQVVELVR
jgi:hypothetical protein